MWKISQYLTSMLIPLLALLNANCGGGYTKESSTTGVKPGGSYTFQTLPGPEDTPNSYPTTQPVTYPTSTVSPTPTSTPRDSGPPPISMTVKQVGYDTPFTFQVQARTILKIRFTPGRQDQPVAGTNYSPAYSRLAVYIKVGNYEEPTPLLSNGLADTQEQGPIMNYSSAFAKQCQASDQACRETVTITVYRPNYDYWCYNWGMYCTHTVVWNTHPWNGTIEVETDDTNSLQQ